MIHISCVDSPMPFRQILALTYPSLLASYKNVYTYHEVNAHIWFRRITSNYLKLQFLFEYEILIFPSGILRAFYTYHDANTYRAWKNNI